MVLGGVGADRRLQPSDRERALRRSPSIVGAFAASYVAAVALAGGRSRARRARHPARPRRSRCPETSTDAGSSSRRSRSAARPSRRAGSGRLNDRATLRRRGGVARRADDPRRADVRSRRSPGVAVDTPGHLAVHHAERRLLPRRHRAHRPAGRHRHLAAHDPRHGRSRDGADVRAADVPRADRARHHARVRLERGRRPLHRERPMGRRSAEAAAGGGGRPARTPTRSSRGRSTASRWERPTSVAMDGRDAMLAVSMNGETLPFTHGFPVRMIVPGLYGYVSATKWLTDIELTTFDAYDPYWIQRGWAQQAPIKTQSRIDTPRRGRERERRARSWWPASPGRSIAGSSASRFASTRASGTTRRLARAGHDRHLAAVDVAVGRDGRRAHARGPGDRRGRRRRSPSNACRRSRTAPPAGTRWRSPRADPASRVSTPPAGVLRIMGPWSNEPSSVPASPRSCTRSSRSTSAPASRSGARRSRSGPGIGVSSATIRNEMAALEELGYLTHPHTSAGRIPTDIGYRHYVDSLPAGGRLRDAQRRAIASYFAEAILDLEEVLKGSVQLLSRLTQYAGLAVPPSVAEEPIVRLELIDMGPTMMVLAVGQHGRVDKRILDRPETLDDQRAARDGAPPGRAPRHDVHGGAGAAAEARGRGRARAPRPAARRRGDAPHGAARGERRARRGRRRVEPGRRGAGVAAGDAPPPVRDARARAGDHARPAGRERGHRRDSR